MSINAQYFAAGFLTALLLNFGLYLFLKGLVGLYADQRKK